uniref:Uncharacterized protein n=1 Tax=Caenorhabditis tropicalis TaxID=1561998 RepID=A0A1I7TJL3_9PELO
MTLMQVVGEQPMKRNKMMTGCRCHTGTEEEEEEERTKYDCQSAAQAGWKEEEDGEEENRRRQKKMSNKRREEEEEEVAKERNDMMSIWKEVESRMCDKFNPTQRMEEWLTEADTCRKPSEPVNLSFGSITIWGDTSFRRSEEGKEEEKREEEASTGGVGRKKTKLDEARGLLNNGAALEGVVDKYKSDGAHENRDKPEQNKKIEGEWGGRKKDRLDGG